MGHARALIVCAASVIALGCTSCGGDAADPSALARERSVGIEALGCKPFPTFGAGAFIADGIVVTAAHVVAGQDDIEVITGNGETHPADLLDVDTEQDVALLEVHGDDITPLKIGSMDADDQAVFIGYAEGERALNEVEIRRRVNLSTGDIYREGDVDRPGYELHGGIDRGDSGGVLVNQSGEAAGIVWSSSLRREDRAWAMRMDPAIQLLESDERTVRADCA